ncbi:MAG: DUF2079 domain-containing protein, partial [PVC group bacterium]
TIFFQPAKVLRGVLIEPKLKYLKDLFIPLAFVSIFSPSSLLMVLISLSEGLLSQRFTHFSIRYQYSSIVTPLVFISAIYGLRNLFKWKIFAGKEKLVLMVVVLFSLVSAKTLGPLFNLPEGIKQWRVTEEDQIRQKFVEKIPPRVPVIATFEFAPKLSMRPKLFYLYQVYSVSRHPDFRINIPEAQKVCQYALLDFNDWLTFYDFYTPGGDRDVYRFLTSGNWRLEDTVNSICLFQKGEVPDLGVISRAAPDQRVRSLRIKVTPQLELTGYSLKKQPVNEAPTLIVNLYFACSGRIPADFLPVVRFISQQQPDFSFQQEFFAPYRIFPTSRWQANDRWKLGCNILIPPDAPSGSYSMEIGLLWQKGRGFTGKIFYRAGKAVTLSDPANRSTSAEEN